MIYVFGGMTYSRYKINHAMNLCRLLNQAKNRKVILIDGSESSFVTMYLASRRLSDIKVVTIDENDLEIKLLKLIDSYDDIVINSAVGPHLEQSLKYADTLLVPFSSADLNLWNMWKLTHIERHLRNALDINSDLCAHSFMTGDKSHKDYEAFVKVLNRSQYLNYMELQQGHQLIGLEELEQSQI